MLRSARIVYVTHLPRMLASRRMLVMALLGLMPVGAGLLVALEAGADVRVRALSEITWFLFQGLIVPFLGLLAGSAVLSEEVADRTLVYPFTRPVSRAGFFLGRTLAAWTCVLVVTVPVAWVLYVPALYGRPLPPGAEASALAAMPPVTLQVAFLGSAAYTILFAALGTMTKHPMIVGVAYSMVFEGLFANLPGRTAGLSLQHHLRSLVVAMSDGQWENPRSGVLAELGSAPDALRMLTIITLLALAAGMLLIRRRQFAAG